MSKCFLLSCCLSCVFFSSGLMTVLDDGVSTDIEFLQRAVDELEDNVMMSDVEERELITPLEGKDLVALSVVDQCKENLLSWGMCTLGVVALCWWWPYMRSRGDQSNSEGNSPDQKVVPCADYKRNGEIPSYQKCCQNHYDSTCSSK